MSPYGASETSKLDRAGKLQTCRMRSGWLKNDSSADVSSLSGRRLAAMSLSEMSSVW